MRSSIAATIPLLTAMGLLSLSRSAQAAHPTKAMCLAASNASLDSSNEHKLLQERAQLLVCADPACPLAIRNECTQRIAEVNSAMPTIIFEVKDESGNDVSAVTVSMDGQPLADKLDGTALSIDPGDHAFVFEMAGHPQLQKHFVIREQEKGRREQITWGSPAVSAPIAGVPTGGPTTAQPVAPANDAGPASSASPVTVSTIGNGADQQSAESMPSTAGQRLTALIVGGAGVVGLGVGTAFGLTAMSKRNQARGVCPDQCTDHNGVNLWSDAKRAGTISTTAFIIGTAGVAAGAVLWLTAKPRVGDTPSAQIGLGIGTVTLGGAW